MSEFLPNSSLVGIHLTIFTHSGPQVVFHYPPSVAHHLKSRVHQSKKAEVSLENEKRYNRGSTDFGRKSNVTGLLSAHSNRSNEFRLQGDDVPGSPDIEGVLANARAKANFDRTKRDETKAFTASEIDSDVGSSSSGLSDSELSTDYADCSSICSQSYDETEDEINQSEFADSTDDPTILPPTVTVPTHTNNSLNSDISHSSRPFRVRNSQISASKLLDMLSTDNQNRRSSLASKMSSAQADYDIREEADDDPEIDNEIAKMMSKGLIGIDDEHFSEENFQELNKVFGFDPEFIAEFCSPEREMCNTRFEFTVDELCFLGLPVHVDANGQWRKSRRKKHSSRSKRSSSSGAKAGNMTKSGGTNDNNNSSNMDNSTSTVDADAISDNLRGSETLDIAKFDDLRQSMDMFHVCFVMNPSLAEYNDRVDDMFHYIVTRLSVLLRYSQAKSAYVSRQCNLILKEKEKVLKGSKVYNGINSAGGRAKYLYQRLFVKSSLAKALMTCVDKLQRNEIACLEIDDDKVISLQIPIQNEFRQLPNFKLHPVLKGSYLTSILNARFLRASPTKDNARHALDMWDDWEDDNDDLLNYALLLLDEPSNILKDLESLSTDDEIGNMVLTHLIKQLQPTIALGSYQNLFNQLLGSSSESSNLAGSQNSFQTSLLRSCALHLLYRRHARVIIPISSKNTYIVSPLAPIGRPQEDYQDAGQYPGLTRPLIYQNQEIFKKRFPSLPSLVSFLNLLSTKKPKPFGNIIPSKEHKPIYLGALTWLIRYGYVTQRLTFVCIRVDKQIKMAVEEDLERESPRVKRENLNREHNTMDNFSKDPNLISQMISQSQLYHSEDDVDNYAYDDPNLEKDYTIILEPERATAIEKRWIFKCIQDQPTDIQFLFNKILRYFNGKTPMELVLIREEISRHDLRRILNALSRYLIEFHHW